VVDDWAHSDAGLANFIKDLNGLSDMQYTNRLVKDAQQLDQVT
jgi:hypothetical protein